MLHTDNTVTDSSKETERDFIYHKLGLSSLTWTMWAAIAVMIGVVYCLVKRYETPLVLLSSVLIRRLV